MKRSTLIIGSMSIFLFAVASLGWWQRGQVLAWWHVRQLVAADDATREACIEPFAALGEDSVAPLLSELQRGDAAVCRTIESALRSVVAQWASGDDRTLRTLSVVRADFAAYSVEGQKAALRFASTLVQRDDGAAMPAAAARLMCELVEVAEPVDALCPAAFGLAGALLERMPAGQWQSTARAFAIKGLASTDGAIRTAALQLAMREPLRKDSELLAKTVPCLRDGEAGVRRAALVALGANAATIDPEQLLPLLHDADVGVQVLCETVLRSQGLSEQHIRMGRMVSHGDPAVRLGVIPLLRQATDLDVDVWLRRLTLDPAPAVRAAAIRFASADPSDDLRQRLSEMASSDPSATVREIARFYIDREAVRNVSK